MSREMHQLKSLRTAARVRLAIMAAPRSTTPSRSSFTSRLVISWTLRPRQRGMTSPPTSTNF